MHERRKHRRGRLSRALTAPLPTAALEARLGALSRSALAMLRAASPVLCVLALGLALADAWRSHAPTVAPRHRAEALCFALAAPPAFSPPMTVESSAALVRGRFNPGTPPGIAVRQVMQLDDRMVLSERVERIGDFEVQTAWLRLPGAEIRHRWLVVSWMEGADLAVCSFRFVGHSDDLTPEERQWGSRLLARVLVPQNFRAAALPAFRMAAHRDGAMPVFGPKGRG
jgi:hypothetical protein